MKTVPLLVFAFSSLSAQAAPPAPPQQSVAPAATATVPETTAPPADRRAWRSALLANRRRIWRAVNGVIERQGVADELSSIKAPTLVLVGAEDVATSPTKAEAIHAAIEGSRLVCIPACGHTATWEQAAVVNAAMAEFLAAQPG